MLKLLQTVSILVVSFFADSILLDERGRAANLLKTSSKRKRTRSEMESVLEEEKVMKENKQEFLAEFKRLKTDKGLDN